MNDMNRGATNTAAQAYSRKNVQKASMNRKVRREAQIVGRGLRREGSIVLRSVRREIFALLLGLVKEVFAAVGLSL